MSKAVKTKQISMFKPVRTKPTQFFQVVLPATLEAKKLKIPDAFVEHLNGFSVAVVMRNKMGKLWHVSLRYIHNEERKRRRRWRWRIQQQQKKEEVEVEDTATEGGGGGGGGYSNSRRRRSSNKNLMTRDKKKCGNNGAGFQEMCQCQGKNASELDNIFTREIVRKYVHRENPYFLSELKKKNNQLLVPRYVLRDFGIQLAEHVTFHDELERTWPGTVICGKDGRTRITGWGPVCRWNQVKKNDLCICEFPEAGGAKNIILVHIHRHAGSQSQATNQEPNQADQ
ncbi:hypothetical protein Patl1_35684 [Pistacia atlantica]|nr:hypothetical protein Patl1_35684 [Pistacia atlantica]